MRRHLVPIAAGILLVMAGPAPAADTPESIIDKAVKAMGGAEKLGKVKAGKAETKGTIILSAPLNITQKITTQLPDQFKEVAELEVAGKQITVITVFDGKKGWLSVNGEAKEAEDKILVELKEAAYMMRAARLTYLVKDKELKLSLLGELKVDDKDTTGIKIASKGHRDVNLYFDKKTGLLVKVERRMNDLMNDKEVTEERIIKEYMEVKGIKIAKKVIILRDGKKFMEMEVLKADLMESVDKDEFAKP